MSSVRVLVGTRKGAFILTSDGKRETWNVSGPHFGGWEIYHIKGSPSDPNRLYASQTSGWFGQMIQRSNDGGDTWEPVGNQFTYAGVPGTHQWYDGTPVSYTHLRFTTSKSVPENGAAFRAPPKSMKSRTQVRATNMRSRPIRVKGFCGG